MDNLAKEILNSSKTSFINSSNESVEELRPKLLLNDYKSGSKVLSSLTKELNDCDSFIFSVAFITSGGIINLLNTLKELEDKGIKGQILTTDYLNFNEPKALKSLLEFSNLEVKVFSKENFHTKGFIFNKDEKYTLIVGSSNLTQTALASNKEWNLKVTSLENGELIKETLKDFEMMWDQADTLTLEWIESEYEPIYFEQRALKKEHKIVRIKQHLLKPNKMQIEATKALGELRNRNETKAMLISATG